MTSQKTRVCGTGYIWTESEQEILKKRYTGTTPNILSLQKALYENSGIMRNPHAIRKMATKLQLTRPTKHPWTEDQIKLLEQLVGKFSAPIISHRVNHSVSSVCNKANELGLKLLQRYDWYTLNETAEILGVWRETVLKWIEHGKLKTSRNTDKEKSTWHITSKQLHDFIVRYPMELTGRNVNMVHLVEILCSPENNS